MNRVLAGRYELTEALARGGMGQVWRARDTSLQRTVAVKVVDVSTADDPTMLERFRREAIATAGLSHPNIVLVYDAGFDEEAAFLVMELLTGPSLQQLVREQGALPLDLGIRVSMEVARGLQAAHRIGVIHRDVKPGNVMFHNPDGHLGSDTGQFGGSNATTAAFGAGTASSGTAAFGAGTASSGTAAFGAGTGQQTTPFAPAGQNPAYGGAGLDTSGAVKLVDFGIAQLSQNTGATLTAPATALGTAAYMAPEQASGTGASSASDWYALGCLMMTIFTGKAPFTGDTFAVAAQQITTEPPRLSDRRPDLPPALDDLIAATLAKDPAQRPDGEQILNQLRALSVDPNAPTMAMGAVGGGTRAMPATAAAPAFAATPSDSYDEYGDEYDEYDDRDADDELERAEEEKARKRGRGALWFLVACVLFAVIAVAGAMMLRDRNQVVPVDPQATPSTSAPATTEPPATTRAPATTKAAEPTKAPPTTKAPEPTTTKPAPTTTKPAPTTTKPAPTTSKPTKTSDDEGDGNSGNGNTTEAETPQAVLAIAEMPIEDPGAQKQISQALSDYQEGSTRDEFYATVQQLHKQKKLSNSEYKALKGYVNDLTN